MKKKLLSLILTLAMLLSLIPAVTVGAAAASAITAYVTISYNGSVIKNNSNNKQMYAVKTTLGTGADIEDAVASAITGVELTYNPNGSYGTPDTENTFSTYSLTYGGITSIYFGTYIGCADGNGGRLGSAVFMDGTDKYGSLSDTLEDGTHYIDVILLITVQR
jgi:hypothetical protein